MGLITLSLTTRAGRAGGTYGFALNGLSLCLQSNLDNLNAPVSTRGTQHAVLQLVIIRTLLGQRQLEGKMHQIRSIRGH